MHELPRELNKSLRSYRGSIYGSVRNDAGDDVEKGTNTQDFGSRVFEQDSDQNPTQTSLVIHPTKSSYGLRQAAQYQQSSQLPQHPQTNPQSQPHSQALSASSLAPQTHAAQRPSTPPQRSPYPGNDSNLTFQPRRQPYPPLSPQTPASVKRSLFSGPKIADPDPASDRLDDETIPLTPTDFYELMGMRAPSNTTTNPASLGLPNGLYTQVRQRLSWVQWQYRVFDAATYALLALQLLLSAVFIILGSLASVNTHLAIAILGAVSIVVAGLLALMKGQGLPNRLRQERDGLRNVIFESDELYWDVKAQRKVYFKDVKKIREDFIRVLETARKNHPDTWTPAAVSIADGVEGKQAKISGKGDSVGVTASTVPAPKKTRPDTSSKDFERELV